MCWCVRRAWCANTHTHTQDSEQTPSQAASKRRQMHAEFGGQLARRLPARFVKSRALAPVCEFQRGSNARRLAFDVTVLGRQAGNFHFRLSACGSAGGAATRAHRSRRDPCVRPSPGFKGTFSSARISLTFHFGASRAQRGLFNCVYERRAPGGCVGRDAV